MISWANLKAMTDSVGVQLDRIKAAMGTGTETGSVSKAADTNLQRVQLLGAKTGGDDPLAAADLLGAFVSQKSTVMSGNKALYNLLAPSINALESHLKDRGTSTTDTFDDIANSNSERYSPSFAEAARGIGKSIAPANVYSPVVLLGTFAISGAAAGVWTDGAAVDVTKYAGSLTIEAEATSTVTSTAITAVATDVDGGTTNCTGTLAGASGTKVNLTAANGKKITDVTGVTITGGAAGQSFKIQTKVDRTPVE